MANSEDHYPVGYRRPPSHTRFTRGRSGNPKGRPKGSQNLATVLAKAGRARIKVTENGVSRSISKLDACMLQLTNQAASGDLKAIRELLYWLRLFAESEQVGVPLPVAHEMDELAMASIVERIRLYGEQSTQEQTDPAATDPTGKEE